MRPSDFLISVLLHSTHLEPKLEQCPTQDSAAAVFSTCVGKTSSNHLKPSAYPSASAWIGMIVPKLNLWRFDKICFMKNIKQTPKHQGGRFMFKKKTTGISSSFSPSPPAPTYTNPRVTNSVNKKLMPSLWASSIRSIWAFPKDETSFSTLVPGNEKTWDPPNGK